MASSAVGAAVSTRLSPVASQRIGMVAFLARMAGIVSAIVSGALPLFIIATIVAGASQGRRDQRGKAGAACRGDDLGASADPQRDLPRELHRYRAAKPSRRSAIQRFHPPADRSRVRNPRSHCNTCHAGCGQEPRRRKPGLARPKCRNGARDPMTLLGGWNPPARQRRPRCRATTEPFLMSARASELPYPAITTELEPRCDRAPGPSLTPP